MQPNDAKLVHVSAPDCGSSMVNEPLRNNRRSFTMRALRIACCLSTFLVALLAFALSTSVASAQGELPCIPVAQGDGSQTCTVHFHDEVMTMHVDPLVACQIPGGTVVETANGVAHITINKAGDEWFTSTMTGPFVFIPDDSSLPTYTGHITGWFGGSFNSQNMVIHSTTTVHATAPNAPPLDFHETFHASISASGITLFFDKLTC